MSRAIRKTRGGLAGPPVVIIAGSVVAVSSDVDDIFFLGNVDVGASHATKKVHALISSEDGNAYVVETVTIGGVGLSKNLAIHQGGTDELNAEIWSGSISSKSGDQAIIVTWGGNVDAMGISVVATHFMESLVAEDTAVYSATSSAGVLSGLSCPAGGITFAVAAHHRIAATASWNILTEQADLPSGGSDSFDFRYTSAWALGARTSAAEVITWSQSGDNVAAGASFR